MEKELNLSKRREATLQRDRDLCEPTPPGGVSIGAPSLLLFVGDPCLQSCAVSALATFTIVFSAITATVKPSRSLTTVRSVPAFCCVSPI